MSKSEQLKRKQTKPIKLTYSQKVNSASEEESDLFYLVKFPVRKGIIEYSTVCDSEIAMDKTNLDSGIVKHRGHSYTVEILKRGFHFKLF